MDGKYILGIDIGTSFIKVFVGKLEIGGGVLIAGSGTIPAEGFTKGMISDSKRLAKSIKQAADCAIMATNISVKDAYVGIGGGGITAVNGVGSIAPLHSNKITLDDMSRVYRAASLVAVPDDHEVLHVLPQKIFIDKQRRDLLPLHEKGSHIEVEAHVISMPKLVLNSLVNDIEQLGINVIGVVANSIAITENIAPALIENCLFMDIGAGTTELVLYQEKQIVLSASLSLGGNYITSDITQGLSICWEHGEEIKKYYAKLDRQLRGQEIVLDCNAYNTADKHIPYDFLYDIIESRICEIVYLIHDYLKVVLAENKVEKVFLTGGCGAMPSFAQNIETTFGIPVEVVIPKDVSLEYISPGNTACCGILKYAGKNFPKTQVIPSSNVWGSLRSKCKRFFNS
jgi:cell division protein FtsA